MHLLHKSARINTCSKRILLQHIVNNVIKLAKANGVCMWNVKITLKRLKSLTHNNFPTSKVEFVVLEKTFSAFGPFQAVALVQSLRYCQVQNHG